MEARGEGEEKRGRKDRVKQGGGELGGRVRQRGKWGVRGRGEDGAKCDKRREKTSRA